MKNIAIQFVLIFGILMASPLLADKAILAGGCFWCMEKDFEALEGVSEVISGFTGGTAENPTYRGDHAGHFEAVEITYDPDTVSYEEILDHFWVNVDPFDDQGQFCDRGPSYRSAIFVSDEHERSIAEKSRQHIAEKFPDRVLATPVLDAGPFYPVTGDESYHQDFYRKSPIRYKIYRWNCGRDRRLREIWGEQAISGKP